MEILNEGPEPGDQVRDKITGFTGTVTARCRYITGPDRLMVEGSNGEGTPIERWWDITRLERIESPRVAVADAVAPTPGQAGQRPVMAPGVDG